MGSNDIKESLLEKLRQGAGGKAHAGALSPATTAVPLGPPNTAEIEAKAEEMPGALTAAQRNAAAVQAMAGQLQPFRDQHGGFCVELDGDVQPIDGQAFADHLRYTALQTTGRTVSNDMVEAVRSMARQVARQRPSVHVFKRVAQDGNDYLIDLGSPQREVARVSATGVTIEPGGAVKFRRPPGYGELPHPRIPDSPREAFQAIDKFRRTCNMREEDSLLLFAVLVEGFRGDTPYPIVVLSGPEGASKSTAALLHQQTLDPSSAGLRSSTLEPRALVATSHSQHLVCVDNVPARVPQEIENLLCVMATGAEVAERALFKNHELAVAHVHNPVIITAINSPLRQADTQDRAIELPIQKPATYREAREVTGEYMQHRAEVLGAILYFLSLVLAKRDEVKAQREYRHRLISLLITGEVIAQSLGAAPGKFAENMDRRRRRAAEHFIEGDGFANPLVETIKRIASKAPEGSVIPGWRQWASAGYAAARNDGVTTVAATAALLARELSTYSQAREGAIPSTARATTEALKRVQGALGRAGITAETRPVNGQKNHAWFFSWEDA